MPLSEFELITRYFAHATAARDDTVLGIGDDCALLQVPPDRQLAVSMDTLVAGRHFLPEVAPDALGHKALAVNLSDLAAMGATPAWATLALTLPHADPAWLAAFAHGFGALAQCHHVQLVGGDTTRGPLAITVQVHGFTRPGQAWRRDGARIGDRIYVSGTLGDAALALRILQGAEAMDVDLAPLRRRLDWPQPRLDVATALAGLVGAAIDISDGLGADLAHICAASGVAAELVLADLPLSGAVRSAVQHRADWSLPLAGGDDYELVVCIPATRCGTVDRLCDAGLDLTPVGHIVAGRGVHLRYPDGRYSEEIPHGFDHFLT